MAISKLNNGDTYTAAHDAAIIDALENTSTGHDHDGSDSKGSLNPTSITCSGATTLNGACTFGDADDNVTIDCGTGKFDLNANRFAIDLDSTNASDDINITRNVSAGTNSLVTLTETHAGSDQAVLKINQGGTAQGLFVFRDVGAACVNALVRIEDENAAADVNTVNLINDGLASALLIDQNNTGGTSGLAALRIDSENTDAAGLYITSKVDATGASWFDQVGLAVAAEGVGGAAQFYSNVSGSNNALVKIHVDHVDTDAPALQVLHDGDASNNNPIVKFETTSSAADTTVLHIIQDGASSGQQINIADGTSTCHIRMVPVADSSTATAEGQMIADTDGIVYYRSNTALAAMNAAADFSEIMESKYIWNNYEDGDVVIIGSSGKIEKSTTPYQTSQIGVISDVRGRSRFIIDRSNKKIELDKMTRLEIERKQDNGENLTVYEERHLSQVGMNFGDINKHKVQVGLIGLVKCKVKGTVNIGDVLVPSDTTGVAMKGTIDSFDKMNSIIGKARESHTGTSTGLIDIVVGVK